MTSSASRSSGVQRQPTTVASSSGWAPKRVAMATGVAEWAEEVIAEATPADRGGRPFSTLPQID